MKGDYERDVSEGMSTYPIYFVHCLCSRVVVVHGVEDKWTRVEDVCIERPETASYTMFVSAHKIRQGLVIKGKSMLGTPRALPGRDLSGLRGTEIFSFVVVNPPIPIITLNISHCDLCVLQYVRVTEHGPGMLSLRGLEQYANARIAGVLQTAGGERRCLGAQSASTCRSCTVKGEEEQNVKLTRSCRGIDTDMCLC